MLLFPINMLEFFQNHTLWTAVWTTVGAIGTFAMAIATFVSLWLYQKDIKKKENREISEKILELLIAELEEIKKNAKSYYRFSATSFTWRGMRSNFLAFKLSEDLRSSLDEFDKFLEEEKNFFIMQEFDNLLEKEEVNWRNFADRYDEIYNQANKLKNKIEEYQKKNL